MPSSNESRSTPDATHLAVERLAAFDDLPFTADETAHLASCALCRAEYEAMVAVVGMAGQLRHDAGADTGPRLVEFDAILSGMRTASPAGGVATHASGTTTAAAAEAAAEAAAPVRAQPTRAVATRGAFAPGLRRAAAAVLLVGSGAVLGRLSGESGRVASGGGVVASSGSVTGAPVSVTPVSLNDRPFADLSYGSVEQATIALNEAQREYERASLWLASNDTTMRDPEVFRARLAALDQMMEASRVALRDAPQDPVLNHYYLAAYSAREATLQALGSALPVDKIIERY